MEIIMTLGDILLVAWLPTTSMISIQRRGHMISDVSDRFKANTYLEERARAAVLVKHSSLQHSHPVSGSVPDQPNRFSCRVLQEQQ